MQTLSGLEEEIKIAALKEKHAQEILEIKRSNLTQKENNLRSLKKAFEEQLKACSVSSLSGKTLLLLMSIAEVFASSNILQLILSVERATPLLPLSYPSKGAETPLQKQHERAGMTISMFRFSTVHFLLLLQRKMGYWGFPLFPLQ